MFMSDKISVISLGATPASSSATGTTTTQSLSTSTTTTTTAAAITDDTALGEINFEELIKASNVTPRILKDDSQYDDKPTKLLSREPPIHQYSGVLPKIAPKPNLTAVKTGNPGQVVIIQSPTGNPVPIRLSGSNNNAQSGKQGGAVTIQVLKMPDGRLVQIKNNKALNLTNLSNVTQFSVGGKKSTTPNTSNSTIIVKSSTACTGGGGGISTQSKLQAGSNTIAGLMKSKANNELTAKQLHKLLPSTSPITATAGTSSFSASQILNAAKQNSQKISLPENKEIRIKSDETGMKQILVSQHLVKLSPNSAGPIQTIEIPGKPGLQYVRVLGTTSAGSSALSKGGTILTGIRPKDTMTPTTTTTTKMAVIPQVIGNQKIIMTSKPRQSLSFASFSKEGTSNILSQASSIKQNQKTLITTVPTLRKINDSTISKPAVPLAKNNDDDPISFDSNNKAKISHLNQQIKKFNSSMSASITSNGQYSSAQNSKTQRLMVPLGIYRQMQANDAQSTKTSTTTITDEFNAKKLYSVLKPSPDIMDEPLYPARKRSPSPDGLPRRKHCNCTKSQCLKLYCDCFANGEFCQDCNCKDCCNNLEFEDERQKAIKICLERNPNAFKPKITKARDQSDLRLHNKGCNCKRSGCLKNYCECYEAKIACSSNCKCFGCRNVEDRSEMDPLEVAKIAQNFGRGVSTKRPYDEISTDKIPPTNAAPQPPPSKQPYNFITQDVVDATIQCMIAQADECNKTGINSKNTERMILEELGRCLVEIIDFSIRNMEN